MRCDTCTGMYSLDRGGEITPDPATPVRQAVTHEYLGSAGSNDPTEYEIASEVVEVLRRETMATGNYLEIGCGSAAIGAVIRDVSPEISYLGVEVSPELYDAIDPQIRRQIIHAGTLEEALARIDDYSQDVVILHHVLEHLPAPCDSLKAIRSKLRPRGFLYVEVPN